LLVMLLTTKKPASQEAVI